MGRPRAFDEQEALQCAMEVFWRRGYTATSVRDLSSELDMRQSSLYATFGDKHALFLRALDHYAATESAAAQRRLGADAPPREVLRAWLMDSVDTLSHDHRGCLMVNSATELAASDTQVAQRVRGAFTGIRDAVRGVLARGQRSGQLADDLDVDTVSALLTTTMLGLRVQARAGAERADLIDAVHAALTTVADGQPASSVT